MNLHLFIPSLFWSDSSLPEIYQDLPLPSLETLLSKSRVVHGSTNDIYTWLCTAFHIEKQHDWPVAPITQHLDAVESKLEYPRSDYWLRADPVHLRIEQNHIMLADRHIFQLTHDEALQFTDAINQLLVNDNITVFPFHPYRWYICLPEPPDLYTHTLNTAICKNINNLMPTGKASINWHKIINEVQMLLHDHPLNQQREARDQLAINSLWLWGGGKLPQTSRSLYTTIWTNNDFVRALGKWSSLQYKQLPGDASLLLQAADSENHFVYLDELLNDDKYNNAYSWRDKLLQLERLWFTPLHTALKNKQITSLKISSINENGSHDFFAKPSSLRKFWSTIKPLSFYADKK